MTTESGVWRGHAVQWERVGPPLRPCARDTETMELLTGEWTARNGAPRVLVLGVTPEISRLGWPVGTGLLAVDRSRSMIDRVWPDRTPHRADVVRADWLDLPLGPETRDVAVGDGVFTVLRYPGEHRSLLGSVARVLSRDGLFAFRTFVRPEERETPAEVCEAALAGEVGSFHAFKLRLLMSLQPDTPSGVRTGDVWEYWSRRGPSAERLSDRCGWPREEIDTIDAYRGSETTYSFPTRAELSSLLREEGFRELRWCVQDYELGERCPTVAWSLDRGA